MGPVDASTWPNSCDLYRPAEPRQGTMSPAGLAELPVSPARTVLTACPKTLDSNLVALCGRAAATVAHVYAAAQRTD